MAKRVDRAPLWRRYFASRSVADRNALVEAYLRLAHGAIARASLPMQVEREELVGTAVEALIRAVEQFDPERGAKFETFAITLLRGAILEYLRDNDTMPRSVREAKAAIERAGEALARELHRLPTETELAAALGWTEGKLRRKTQEVIALTVESLDAPVGFDRGGRLVLYEDVLGDASDTAEAAIEAARQAQVLRALAKLPERERNAVVAYLWAQKSHREIAAECNLSESRVYQLYQAGLKRLRERLEEWR